MALNNVQHGLSRHPLFGRWYRMIRRCGHPSEAGFANYGARGIKVCPQWHDPAAYIAYVERELGPQPTTRHTIDRIDNDRDYEPGNLRWATRSEQCTNQRQRVLAGYPVGESGFRGVRLHRKTGRWHARIHVNGQARSLGYFATAEEAARAYDVAAKERGGVCLRLNFPEVSG